MTYSIVARDPESGHLGIAVASRFFAVGSHVPHIRCNAAVATQAFVNPMWGIEGVLRLSGGENAADVLLDFISRDDGEALRQAHMIDAQGQSVAHTGSACTQWAGHLVAQDVSVAGNMLAGPDVVADTMVCYRANMEKPFPERLLLAMEAGENAGGDKRGRQAAALRIHNGEDYPHFDFRVDDHNNPLAELRRLHAVAGERLVHFTKTMATSENFSGTTDRTELDADIARREAESRAKNIPSQSLATSTDI